MIEAPADEIDLVAKQLQVNPADGPVRLTVDENGSLIAEWTSGGTPTKVGPAITRPLDG